MLPTSPLGLYGGNAWSSVYVFCHHWYVIITDTRPAVRASVAAPLLYGLVLQPQCCVAHNSFI